MILSIPSSASLIHALRHPVPGFLSVCKAPKNFVPVRQKALRDCKLSIPIHCKLPSLNLTRHLSIMLGMAQAQVLPREEVQRLGAEFGRHPVGTGPFRFVHWVAGEAITLEANEAYYEGRPFLDRLHYRIMTNHQDILAEFEKGTLEDVDLTGQEGTPLSSDARFRFVRKPLLATVFLWLDTRHSSLSNR